MYNKSYRNKQMPISPQKLKDKLSDFCRYFLMETNVFDKLVMVYKYFIKYFLFIQL